MSQAGKTVAGRTDEDGYFSFLYKHKGKAAMYGIVLSGPVGDSTQVQLKGNGWATALYNYDDDGTGTYVGTWELDWK